METLRSRLRRIDGRSYKTYKELAGVYDFGLFTLSIDHVQGDPFADPSRISVQVAAATAGFPPDLWEDRVRRTALEDFLGRGVAAATGRMVRGRRGSGRSGEMAVAPHGEQVLRRNAVLVSAGIVEARLTAALPAAGRRILGGEAEAMLLQELPQVVSAALLHSAHEPQAVRRHLASVEDQQFLRRRLAEEGWVAFVADGAILPRRSGVDDRPLPAGAVPFAAPAGLARTVRLPHAGEVRGLAVPRGVTLIVGGGFHGKSTLLHALERGVYDHRPGDGRERVATDPTAVKIRAEDGRIVHGVDLSPFIRNLPHGRDTVAFASDNASGSTSMAANLMESLEVGARTLLIDEDTSATNFVIRDRRMQQLVTPDKEPIVPLLHRVRELYENHGVSTVLVMGGSGDYFEVADTVIMLDSYRLREVTGEARRLAGGARPPRAQAAPLPAFGPRSLPPELLDPSWGPKEVKIEVRGVSELRYGEQEIDLSRVEQLVDAGQSRAVGRLILRFSRLYRHLGLAAGMRRALADAEEEGLDLLNPWKAGDLALPRLYEAAAALNRLRRREPR